MRLLVLSGSASTMSFHPTAAAGTPSVGTPQCNGGWLRRVLNNTFGMARKPAPYAAPPTQQVREHRKVNVSKKKEVPIPNMNALLVGQATSSRRCGFAPFGNIKSNLPVAP